MFDLTKLNTNLMKASAIVIALLISTSFVLSFLNLFLLIKQDVIQYSSIFQTIFLSLIILLTTFCLINLADVVQKNIIKKIGFITLVLTLLGVLLYLTFYFYFNSLILIPKTIIAISELLLFVNMFLTGRHTRITGFDLAAGLFIIGIFLIDMLILAAFFIIIILLFRINQKLEKINRVDKTLNITQSNCPVCGKKLGFSYLECSSCRRHFCYEHAKHVGNEAYCFECLGKMGRKL